MDLQGLSRDPFITFMYLDCLQSMAGLLELGVYSAQNSYFAVSTVYIRVLYGVVMKNHEDWPYLYPGIILVVARVEF